MLKLAIGEQTHPAHIVICMLGNNSLSLTCHIATISARGTGATAARGSQLQAGSDQVKPLFSIWLFVSMPGSPRAAICTGIS